MNRRPSRCVCKFYLLNYKSYVFLLVMLTTEMELQLIWFSLLINLSIIFLINCLVVWFIKCQKIVKNSRYNFQESKVTSSCIIFCLSNNPKPKDHQFNIIWQIKTLNHHIWEAETDRKLLKRLISYQNSWLKIIIND